MYFSRLSVHEIAVCFFVSEVWTSCWQQEGPVCAVSSGYYWIPAVPTERRQCIV